MDLMINLLWLTLEWPLILLFGRTPYSEKLATVADKYFMSRCLEYPGIV